MNSGIVLSVKDVNRYIKTVLEYDDMLSGLRVEGEISNFKRHSSGHLYFSLKDKYAKLNCVMFRGDTYSLSFDIEDGMNVIIDGYISVFEKNGAYQLYVKEVTRKGLGKLYEEYTRLLNTLKDEGYFEENLKKPIPQFPKKVAVITSPTGAAVRDIISVISRRNKFIQIIVCPVKVQGVDAAEQVAQMIYDVNRLKLADVIITGRGGGSIEELWAFNERVVAQAVYDSEIPVVSAVGHETDFTICDFVSDLRAPTPSVAAERVSMPIEDMKLEAVHLQNIITRQIIGKIEEYKSRFDNIINKPVMKRPEMMLNNFLFQVDYLKNNIAKSYNVLLNGKENRLDMAKKLIESYSVMSVLKRGYSIVRCNDKVVKSVKDVRENENVDILMNDGNVTAVIEEIKENKDE